MSKAGLTLAELLVVMAVIVPVAAAAAAFYSQTVMFWEKYAAKAEALQHARITLEEVSNEIFYARWAEVAADGRQILYDKEVRGGVLRYSIYHRTGQILHGLPEGTAVPLAYSIESLTFSPAGPVIAGRPVKIEVASFYDGVRVVLRTSVTPRGLKGDGYE